MTTTDLIGFCAAHKRIFCYGAGKYGSIIRAYLYEHGFSINAFIVSQKKNQHARMQIPVVGVEDVSQIDDDATGIIIGVGIKSQNEVVQNLKRFSVRNWITVSNELFKEMEQSLRYSMDIRNPKNICVLLYHRVCDLHLDIWNLAITPKIFELHVQYFKNNYNILRFEDDWQGTNEPSLILTFDDGYADNFQYALPILEKYQVPATIFVSTGNVGTYREFWWNELERILCLNSQERKTIIFDGKTFPLSSFEEKVFSCQKIRLRLKNLEPEKRELRLHELAYNLGATNKPRMENRSLSIPELRRLAKSPLITIGGHTITHTMLSAESEELQKKEIQGSKARLEDLLDCSVDTFSYPFGSEVDYTETTVRLVKEAGYRKAATTSAGLVDCGSNPMLIPRNGMPFFTQVEEIGYYLRKCWCLSD